MPVPCVSSNGDRLIGAIGDLIRGELSVAVPEPIRAAADGVRARHGDAVAAILFYGSCLREGSDAGKIVDFYVLVRRYRDFHKDPIKAWLNAALPPNVYYLEVPYRSRVVRIKYAVYTLAAFERNASHRTLQSTVWARFAQPCALVYAADKAVADRVTDALSTAVHSAAAAIAPLMPARFASREFWLRLFEESYESELRAEAADRPQILYERFAERYDRVSQALFTRAQDGATFSNTSTAGERRRARWKGRVRRIVGKTLNAARLIKAAFTFEGGLDYVLWKVETHSGVRMSPSPWQRRHPVLAAPVLAWRLYRAGAFR